MELLQPFMNITDIAVGVFLLFGLLSGIKRGLSNELFRMISIVVAVTVAWRFDDLGAAWLAEWTEWPAEELVTTAFFGIIVATYIFLAVVRLALRLFMSFSFKPKLERLGGGLFGLSRAVIFAIIILFAIIAGNFGQALGVEESVSGQLVRTYVIPRYHAVAEQYPELNLPAVDETGEPSNGSAFDPDIGNYIGPLIDIVDDQEEGSE